MSFYISSYQNYHGNNDPSQDLLQEDLPQTINPRLLQPSLFNSNDTTDHSISANFLSSYNLLPYQEPTYSHTPQIDIATYNTLSNSEYSFHPLNRVESSSIWLSEDWKVLPLLTSPSSTPSINTPYPFNLFQQNNHINPTFFPYHDSTTRYTQSLPQDNTIIMNSIATINNNNNKNLPHSPQTIHYLPPQAIHQESSTSSQEVIMVEPDHTARSSTFPFSKLNMNNHLGSSSERAAQTIITNDMGCQNQQYPLGPPIQFPSSSSSSSSSSSISTVSQPNPFWHSNQYGNIATSSNINPLQPGLSSGEETELDSDDEDEYKPIVKIQIKQNPVENKIISGEKQGEEEEEGGEEINIELSSTSAGPSLISNSKAQSKRYSTRVLSLEEEAEYYHSSVKTTSTSTSTSNSTDATEKNVEKEKEHAAMPQAKPNSASTKKKGLPKFKAFVPKSFKAHEENTKDKNEIDQKPPSPLTRNGRYPTRLTTIRIKEEIRDNDKNDNTSNRKSKLALKIKKDKKGNSVSKVENNKDNKNQRINSNDSVTSDATTFSTTTSSSSEGSTYNATTTTSNRNVSGNTNGGKVPSGAFIWQLMRMLACDKFPGYVILRNGIAYIPDTEAFSKVVLTAVYSEYEKKDKNGNIINWKSKEWTSFQRNLNNYIGWWPFERTAVPGTGLKSQTITVPTIKELSKKWNSYKLDSKILEKELIKLKEWSKRTKPLKPLNLKYPIPQGIFKSSSTSRCKKSNKKPKWQQHQEQDENFDLGYESESESILVELTSEEQREFQNSLKLQQASSSPKGPPTFLQDRDLNRINSEEKIQLGLRLDGSQLPITPEKEKNQKGKKRTFASLSSESPESASCNQKSSNDPDEIFTPSPTFSSFKMTPQTTNMNTNNETKAKKPRSNFKHKQLPTPASLNKSQPRSAVHPIINVEPQTEQSGSSSLSSGNQVEVDVFGPIMNIAKEGKGKSKAW
ncbi:uncharacterized protein L201_007018 [Kwoniella dendrophila CBS 6074]|uniref:Fork-head domain-containing protein n=1 Tax=Kwoniella dendrophila CBS 6074 TaxID=1295534 RepID=A0AAX4K4L3_9TREE